MCPPLTPEDAAGLYRAFLADVFALIDEAVGSEAVSRVFSCARSVQVNAGDFQERARALAPDHWRVVEQGGASLGERIESARASTGARRVLVLGSDAPTMPSGRITAAFEALEEDGVHAVFGPTEDGGYDLVGFDGPAPALLEGIPWSTDRVMHETRVRASAARLRIVELAPGYDIDHAEDLPRALADAERLGRTTTAAAIQRVLAKVRVPD